MSCDWGRTDCVNEGEKCHLCASPDFHYQPPKQRKQSGMARSQAKESGRKGAGFELRNHHAVNDMLTGASTRMTPNSGAGQVKGDQEIRGIIQIMEELKEQNNKKTTRGETTFTIHKEWLEKLDREAKAAGKEFWYLKFSFNKADHDTFVVVDADIIMAMINTMVEDRKAVTKVKLEAEVSHRRRETVDAENTLLLAQIAELKARLAEKEHELEMRK